MTTAETQDETFALDQDDAGARPEPSELRDLLLFTAGERTFAVFADQVESTAEEKTPAAVPHAPPAVLGVVCMRHRMLTVLDPTAILTGETLSWPRSLACLIGLRGDEQLALAAQSYGETITIAIEDIEKPEGQRPAQSAGDADGSDDALLGMVKYGGQTIPLLDTSKLFASAVRRKERRRRRF